MAEQDAIDELYGLPLDEFTPARDALAARLRDGGDKTAAARIKKLRKPSVAAWAVNQLAHRDPERLERLFDLRAEIEDATDAKKMREASDERRRSITELVKDAERILRESGHAASANTVQAITQTLHAGDTDDERTDLIRGRLARELQPSGFGAFGGFDFGAADESDDGTRVDPRFDEATRKYEELLLEAEDAEREAAAAERVVGEAERALDTARARATSARRSAEQALKHAERAKADIDRLDK